MRVRNDHDVPGSVREAIENDERLFAAINNQCFFIAVQLQSVAQKAFRLFALGDLRHVLVAPG